MKILPDLKGALVELAVQKPLEWLGRQLRCHETSIRVFKRFGIGPQVPIADFESVYAYSLVKFGRYKPEPILQFFRYRYVREAFRKSFEQGDPSVLKREAEEILQWNRETKEFGHIDGDVIERELAEFQTIFLAMVERTSEPTQVVTHRMLGEVLTKLDRMSPEHGASSANQTSGIVSAVLETQWERLSQRVSGDVETKLEQLRIAWHEGRKAEAVTSLKELKNDPTVWAILSEEVQAKLLAFEGSLELDSGRIERAEQLVTESLGYVETDSAHRLQALIVHRMRGPEDALTVLKETHDIENINLRAAFLLEMGKLDEGSKLLELERLQPNAETYRLRALQQLVAKEIQGARLEAQKALELEPQWIRIRFAAAVIDYHGALSAAALPGYLSLWPEPIDPLLVKQDDQSLEYLQGAAKEFEELGRVAENDEEATRYHTWRLACLLNHGGKQDVANDLCLTLLELAPGNPHLMNWALSRQVEGIDLGPSAAAIERRVADKAATIAEIGALLNYYFFAERTERALETLNSTKEIFRRFQVESFWAVEYAKALALSGETEAALTYIDSSEFSAELRHVKTMALVERARHSNEWTLVLQHLEESYSATQDPRYLLDSCVLMAHLERWEYIAQRAENLIRLITTAEAVTLSVIAAYNAQKFDLCLDLLNKYQSLFTNEQLPASLRRIKVVAQQELGILSQAMLEAEELANEEPTVPNLLELAQLYFNIGDFKKLAVVARKLHRHPDLRAEQALQLSRALQWEDRDLAKALWRMATTDALPDILVSEAYFLGHQLNVEQVELQSLQARLHALATEGRAGILKFSTLEELRTFFESSETTEARVPPWEAYQQGIQPIHFVVQELNIPLVELYHNYLLKYEKTPDPLHQFALLARHGSRIPVQGFQNKTPDWVLNLDITAILLGAHFDILGEVEQVFAPLKIPTSLIPALIQMRERMTPHQPARLEALRMVFDLYREGLIETPSEAIGKPKTDELDLDVARLEEVFGSQWIRMFIFAQQVNGYVVDFLPLHKHGFLSEPLVVPEAVERHITNSRAILESLRQQGPLSQREYENLRHQLGAEGSAAPSKNIPSQGTTLFLTRPILETLANAGLLRLICERFTVRVLNSIYKEIEGTLEHADSAEETIIWLDQLMARLRSGLEDGRYEIIAPNTARQEELSRLLGEGPMKDCLGSILAFAPREGDVIWADDRWLNGFPDRDGVPIIGINEVLKALVGAGSLGRDEYYMRLNQLRRTNIRFIPLEAEEIIYELLQARVDSGAVIETAELAALRRYLAATLLSGNILQKTTDTNGMPDRRNEIFFVQGVARAVLDAIADIWTHVEDETHVRRLRADWILDNLFLDHQALFSLVSWSRPNQDDRHIIATSLGGLIGQAIGLDALPRNNEASVRRSYLDWLYERILYRRFEADPTLVPVTANVLKELFGRVTETADESTPRDTILLALRHFFDELPEPLRKVLQRDSDFMHSVGFEFFVTVDIMGLAFHQQEFYQAAANAINGQEAQLLPIGIEQAVIFRPHDGQDAFAFTDPRTQTYHVIKDERLALLSESPSSREAYLRQYQRAWFDCPPSIRETAIAEIASAKTIEHRMELADKWLQLNIERYYADLYQAISQRKQLRFADLLPPENEGLLWHYRLMPTINEHESFTEALAASAVRLAEELGIDVALNRLIAFPTLLPTHLTAMLSELSREERRTHIKRLLRVAHSPVSKLHTIRVLLQFNDDYHSYRRLARLSAKALLNEECLEYHRAYLIVLQWVRNEFRSRFDEPEYPLYLRLAMTWAYAHSLFEVLVVAGASPNWIIQAFINATSAPSIEILFDVGRERPDVSEPQSISLSAFLAQGLSYSISPAAEKIRDDELHFLFSTVAFQRVKDQLIPSFGVLRIAQYEPNSLDSFFGGDFSDVYSEVFQADVGQWFAPSARGKLVEDAIDTLSADLENTVAWEMLNALLDGASLADDTKEQLVSILTHTDYVELLESSVELGLMVIQLAASQAIHLGGPDLCEYVEKQWLRVVEYVNSEELDIATDTDGVSETDLQSQIATLLLSSPIYLSACSPTTDEASIKFAALMSRLFNSRFPITSSVTNVVKQMVEQLPSAKAQPFWPLLMQIRARKT